MLPNGRTLDHFTIRPTLSMALLRAVVFTSALVLSRISAQEAGAPAPPADPTPAQGPSPPVPPPAPIPPEVPPAPPAVPAPEPPPQIPPAPPTPPESPEVPAEVPAPPEAPVPEQPPPATDKPATEISPAEPDQTPDTGSITPVKLPSSEEAETPAQNSSDKEQGGPDVKDNRTDSDSTKSNTEGKNAPEVLAIILTCLAAFMVMIAFFVLRVSKAQSQSEIASSASNSMCSHEVFSPIPGLPRSPSENRKSRKSDKHHDTGVESTLEECNRSPVFSFTRSPSASAVVNLSQASASVHSSTIQSPSGPTCPSPEAADYYERRSSDSNFSSEHSSNSYLSSLGSSLESLGHRPSTLRSESESGKNDWAKLSEVHQRENSSSSSGSSYKSRYSEERESTRLSSIEVHTISPPDRIVL